jgi:hypothetical protein
MSDQSTYCSFLREYGYQKTIKFLYLAYPMYKASKDKLDKNPSEEITETYQILFEGALQNKP